MIFSPFAVSIEGTKTDIVVANFSDSNFILITQLKKPACILRVSKETFQALDQKQVIYKVESLFGSVDPVQHSLARFLAQEIEINGTTIFAFGLINFTPPVARALRDILLKHKNW